MGWRELRGTPKQFAGTSGTVTLPAGAFVILVVAHASTGSATTQILGGPSIPIVSGAAPTTLKFDHDLLQANANSNAIVFTNTDSYFVLCVASGNV